MHSLSAIDLNLVVALHALLEERTVTGAARRVGLSQPAMSHALARLRAHFDDPLLIRSGRTMAPTARALALLEQVRPTVRQLEALMSPRPPAPAEMETSVRLATDDYIGCTGLPEILRRLGREAPGVTLEITPRGSPGRKAMVRRGQVDLAIGYFSGAGMDLKRQALYTEGWLCALRRGHPALDDGPLTPEAWAGLRHVIVSPTGGRRGEVDRRLEAAGLSRRVAVTAPHFSAALAAVGASDLALTTPARLARAEAERHGLALFPPPLPMATFEISMIWHARTEHDPAQRWFRELAAACLGDAPAEG